MRCKCWSRDNISCVRKCFGSALVFMWIRIQGGYTLKKKNYTNKFLTKSIKMTFKIKKQNINLTAGFCSRSRLEPGWLAGPEPSLWPGSSSTLKICLIIQENYMELNIIWCLFWSKHEIWPTCTGTCVRTYFRQFVVSFEKIPTFCSLLTGARARAGSG